MTAYREFGRSGAGNMRFTSEYINASVLLANTAELVSLPSAYNVVIISSTAPVYVKFGDNTVVATVPSDTSDGTASELNPAAYAFKLEQTNISLISPFDCVVTLAYYEIH